MKIKIKNEDFKKALQKIHGVVPTKDIISILCNVLLEAKDGLLYITAINTLFGCRYSIPVEVEKEGKVAVHADQLLKLLRSVPEEVTWSVELQESFLNMCAELSTGSRSYNLRISNPEDFPELQISSEEEFKFSVPAEILSNLIKKVIFATASEEVHPELTGIYFFIEGNLLQMVATDTRRLSLVNYTPSVASIGSLGKIVPKKALSELVKMLEEGNVEISFAGQEVHFNMPNVFMAVRTIEGNFPDYRAVIPSNFIGELKIQRELFESEISGVSAISDEKTKIVVMELKEGSLRMTSSSIVFGESESNISVDYHGEPVKIAFNPSYIIEPLKVIEDDFVLFKITGPTTPAVLQPESGDHYLNVIMPLSLGE